MWHMQSADLLAVNMSFLSKERSFFNKSQINTYYRKNAVMMNLFHLRLCYVLATARLIVENSDKNSSANAEINLGETERKMINGLVD